jgi:hypothetical protein
LSASLIEFADVPVAQSLQIRADSCRYRPRQLLIGSGVGSTPSCNRLAQRAGKRSARDAARVGVAPSCPGSGTPEAVALLRARNFFVVGCGQFRRGRAVRLREQQGPSEGERRSPPKSRPDPVAQRLFLPCPVVSYRSGTHSASGSVATNSAGVLQGRSAGVARPSGRVESTPSSNRAIQRESGFGQGGCQCGVALSCPGAGSDRAGHGFTAGPNFF